MFFQGKNWPWCESNQLGDREYKVVKGTCWKLSWPWISSSRNLSWPWIRSCGNLSLLPTANTNWYQIDSREIIPSEQINQPNWMFFSILKLHTWTISNMSFTTPYRQQLGIFGNDVDHLLISFAFDCVSYMLSEGKLSYVSCIISEETLVSI